MAQHHAPSGTQTATRTGESKGDTGVKDSTYNVISVVYHALQAAETIDKYLHDVHADDAEIGQFLRDAQEQNKRIAQRGRECLGRILQGQGSSGQQMQAGVPGSQQGSGARGSSEGSAGQQGGTRRP